MEPNNFEKNIQQKLDELKIGPSDSVWTNVEKHIGKKNRKRKALFILFFFFLFLFLGGFWFINSERNNRQKDELIASVSKKDSKPTNSPDSSFNQGVTATNVSPKSVTIEITIKKSITKNHPVEKIAFVSQKNIHSTEIKTATSKPTMPTGRQANNEESYFISIDKDTSLIEQVGIIETKPQPKITGVQEVNKQDSLHEKSELQKIKKETASVNDSIIKKSLKKVQKHPLNFGFTFSGGSSFTTKNHSTGNLIYSDPSGNTTNGGVPGYYYTPSEMKNSTAFITGVFAEKNISNENKISIGISYQYFSLVNKVGNAITPSTSYTQYSSSYTNLYNGSNANNSYRNQFHFLEIPLSISFRINKSKSAPLYWNAGINISELISSNALQFQSNPGIYYKNNSLFNKTQFGLNTGFSVMLFAKEKNPLTVGPYFFYSPTNISSKGLYGNNHFTYIGIQANLLFRKK